MSENQPIIKDKTKWYKTRLCACGDCRFFSEVERPKCPAMEADKTLTGEWLWSMRADMIGCKDYEDPLDFAAPKAFTEKEVDNEKEE